MTSAPPGESFGGADQVAATFTAVAAEGAGGEGSGEPATRYSAETEEAEARAAEKSSVYSESGAVDACTQPQQEEHIRVNDEPVLAHADSVRTLGLSRDAPSDPAGLPDVSPKTQCTFEEYTRAEAAVAERGDSLVLVLDTETNGLKRSVVELGWVLADSDGAELVARDCVWRPMEGYVDHIAQKFHNIPDDELMRAPDPEPELRRLMSLLEAVRASGARAVAHNARFDVARIRQTADLCGVRFPDSVQFFCTMERSKRHCGLKAKDGRAKNPSNIELFDTLHPGRVPCGQLHRALSDVRITLASYTEGHRRGWW